MVSSLRGITRPERASVLYFRRWPEIDGEQTGDGRRTWNGEATSSEKVYLCAPLPVFQNGADLVLFGGIGERFDLGGRGIVLPPPDNVAGHMTEHARPGAAAGRIGNRATDEVEELPSTVCEHFLT